MREIKFRVSNGTHTIGYETITDGQWFASDKGIDWGNGTYTGEKLKRWQYTGQLDKNGAEIFEGDIVKLSDDQDYLVDWSEGGAYFHLIGKDDEIPNGGDRLLVAHLGWIEIIGNIYENPELLKSEEESRHE